MKQLLFILVALLLAPSIAFASDASHQTLNLTAHWVGYAAIAIFVIAYTLVILEVIDNAGNYCNKGRKIGLGLQIVDKRIKNKYGLQYGLTMSCKTGEYTKAKITFPLLDEVEVPC